ncbi:hypothetical protein ApDm4_0830 [Acetobacter pomorum]|nr:hypothetical protein ApDm4_0830 [Acetobacter pomorum]
MAGEPATDAAITVATSAFFPDAIKLCSPKNLLSLTVDQISCRQYGVKRQQLCKPRGQRCSKTERIGRKLPILQCCVNSKTYWFYNGMG